MKKEGKMAIIVLLLLFLSGVVKAQSSEKETDTLHTSTVSMTAERKIYTFVEQNPEFQGGDDSLIKFIRTNMKYPAMERDSGREGKVLVKFIVDEEGLVTAPVVVRSAGPAFDAEALRVMSLIPPFKPGHQQGKPAAVYFMVPFSFKLTDRN